MTKLLLRAAVLAAWFSLPAGAVQVSLEENKAERGTVGYVDMQAIFRAFPETKRAKESFEAAVRQAEDQVNLRKSELISLRGELADFKMQRAFMARAPIVAASTAPAAGLPAAPSPLPAAPGIQASTAAATAAALVRASTAAVRAAAPDPLADMDKKIAEKSAALDKKEADFKDYQARIEKNLLDLESRKTEYLLGKIYAAVQQAAKDEGVSVVVDKSQILFGPKAVDLTQKVLEKLK